MGGWGTQGLASIILPIVFGEVWEGETGSICAFAFSLVLQDVAVLRYPDAGSNGTKGVAKCWYELGLESSVPPYASRQSTGKMTNRPRFAHIVEGNALSCWKLALTCIL